MSSSCSLAAWPLGCRQLTLRELWPAPAIRDSRAPCIRGDTSPSLEGGGKAYSRYSTNQFNMTKASVTAGPLQYTHNQQGLRTFLTKLTKTLSMWLHRNRHRIHISTETGPAPCLWQSGVGNAAVQIPGNRIQNAEFGNRAV